VLSRLASPRLVSRQTQHLGWSGQVSRSDIFSLGSVLYEMVTGQKAFQGTSKLSTLSAILHQEPKPASEIGQAIPTDLEKLISRCLRKDPERRIQHMGDVKLALPELKEDSDSGRLQAVPATAKQVTFMRLVIGATAVVALMVLAVAGWYWLSRQRTAEPEAPLKAVPLTSYPGYENVPSFSPDGNFVAFEWCGEAPGANCDIYVKQIGMEPPSPLTSDPAVDFSPAWSPDGLFIAFLRQVSRDKSAAVVVPQRGGLERVLGESNVTKESPFQRGPFLAWTPDSKCLVTPSAESDKAGRGLSLLSIATLEKRRLTTCAPGFSDSTPAFSPDGRKLAFARSGGARNDIYILRFSANYEPQGSPQRVVEPGEPYIWSADWTSDGSEIVFSSGSWSSGSLWRMAASASAKPRRLPVASEDVGQLAVSRKGNRLAYMVPKIKFSIWRVDLRGPSQTPDAPSQLIPSTRSECAPAYSPDGRRIAFMSDLSGHFEIWVCDNDGSNALKLTSLGGGDASAPRWSPDGRKIAFDALVEGNQSIYVIGAHGGAHQRLTAGPHDRYPCWSHDGKSIYFRSLRSGTSQIWRMPAGGGDAVQISHDPGADLPHESPDGRFLYYSKGWPNPQSVWRVAVEGGEATKVLDGAHPAGVWTVAECGIYFFTSPDEKGHSDLSIYEFATGKTRKILTVERQIESWIAVSPDNRTILYTQLDQAGSDLMLVENFR
jgi:Tol biopolymer transport system component